MTTRTRHVVAELCERDVEVLDALLDLTGEDHEAEREFLDWRTGDTDVRTGELAEAMIAHAGRR